MTLICFDKRVLLLIAILLFPSCSPPAEPVPPQQEAEPISANASEPDRQQSEPKPVPDAPTPPQKDANGCTTFQAPGHYEGEGLGKRYVPGPMLTRCDVQPLPVPPRADGQAN